MDEVEGLVRQHDQDHYLASLVAPEDKRPHLLALYAFSVEISRIASLVHEPQLGEIRLQWWLDTLDGIYDGVAQAQPVARALGAAIKVGDIPKHALVNLAKAHAFDFYSDAMPNLFDLEAYLGETCSSLIQMAAMILDRDSARECAEAAGLAGVVYGLAQVLNHLPVARRLQQNFIPAELLLGHQIPSEGLYEPGNGKAVAGLLEELLSQAKERQTQLRRGAGTIKQQVAPAFLHVTLANAMLDRAKKRGAGVLTQGCELGQLRKQWLLWRAARGSEF